ncbi:MAG TPA: O-methyltransferase [Vicinamibacterales bacterium]|jgi:predicted O-methyltransferase YrrM|nr:O-methyltransferase [Vicinamibacterales bacterium]
MGQIVPTAVEQYLGELNTLADPLLIEMARYGAERDLPLVDAEVGAFLRVIARAIGATRALEIGTAIGYSGIWIAGALPDEGMLLSVELDEERAKVARENFAKAGLSNRVNVMIGDAARLVAKIAGPFDLIFQDGAKSLYVPLLDPLVERLRPGGLLITDNVLWDGEVVPGFVSSPHRNAADTEAIAEYNRRISRHPQLMTTILPIRDGVAVSLKVQSR